MHEYIKSTILFHSTRRELSIWNSCALLAVVALLAVSYGQEDQKAANFLHSIAEQGYAIQGSANVADIPPTVIEIQHEKGKRIIDKSQQGFIPEPENDNTRYQGYNKDANLLVYDIKSPLLESDIIVYSEAFQVAIQPKNKGKQVCESHFQQEHGHLAFVESDNQNRYTYYQSQKVHIG